jgi:hypothetical protein
MTRYLLAVLLVGLVGIGLTTEMNAETTTLQVNEKVTATVQETNNGTATVPDLGMVAIEENATDPTASAGCSDLAVASQNDMNLAVTETTVLVREISVTSDTGGPPAALTNNSMKNLNLATDLIAANRKKTTSASTHLPIVLC